MSDSVPAGYKEAMAPELFKFEKPGDHIEGIFMMAKTEIINGDKVLEIYLSTGRRVVRIRPGFDIRSKINRGMIGKSLYILYKGDDHEKGKDGNPMKIFGVYQKDAPAKVETRELGDDDPGITDDDIPF